MDPIFIWFGVASATGTTAISTVHDNSEYDSLGQPSLAAPQTRCPCPFTAAVLPRCPAHAERPRQDSRGCIVLGRGMTDTPHLPGCVSCVLCRKPVVQEELPVFKNPTYACDYGYSSSSIPFPARRAACALCLHTHPICDAHATRE